MFCIRILLIIYGGWYLGVEFFFIVFGFFLESCLESGDYTARSYLIGRIKKLYPHYIISIVIMAFIRLFLKYDDAENISQSLFQHILLMQNLNPTKVQLNGFLWYVQFLLIICPLIFYIDKRFCSEKLIIIKVIYVFAYYLVALICFGHLNSTDHIFFVPTAFYRALADITVGMLCFKISKKLSSKSKYNLFWVLPLMILEFFISAKFPLSRFDISAVIIFSLCITITSKMEFRKFYLIDLLSKHTYALYCYQLIAIGGLQFVIEHTDLLVNLSDNMKRFLLVFITMFLGFLFDFILMMIKKSRIYAETVL